MVKEFVYLGVRLQRRANIVVRQVWGIGERKFKDDFKRKLMIFDSLVKGMMLNGAELFGWAERAELERVQQKYIHWCLGLDYCTPGYIILEDKDRSSMEAGTLKHLIDRCQKVKRTELKEEEILEGRKNERVEKWLRFMDKQKRKISKEQIKEFRGNETNNFGDSLLDCVGSTQFDENEVQFPRTVPDEVISVYEVFVKEEPKDNIVTESVQIISSAPSSNDHQLIQSDLHNPMNLDTATIDSEVIKVESTVGKFLGKDALNYKILEQCIPTNDNNVVVYSHPITDGQSSSTTRLIDKDDIRSRLHFVKRLKRDGKTIKIWECGICMY
ncbi:hypothetical protein M0802_011964 [Mischocyttarus mexicanus]|nr:hypothetical protein M0802_011964 [Mischocyttarus mexicanus]